MITSSAQTIRRFSPAHKENKYEAGRTKKLASAQETEEAPCNEEIHGGEEIKGVGSVKIEDREGISVGCTCHPIRILV